MADNKDQILRFLVKAEGSDALVPFLKSVETLEGASDETRAAAAKLLAEIAKSAKLQTSLESFKKLEDSMGGLERKAEAAKLKVATLASEIAKAEAPTKTQQTAFERAQRASEGLTRQLEDQRLKLGVLGAQLKVAGLDTSNFAKSQAEIATRSKTAQTGLEQLAASATKAGASGLDLSGKMGVLKNAFATTQDKLTAITSGVSGLGEKMIVLNQAAELAGKVLSTIGNVGNFLGDQIAGAGEYELALGKVEARTRATAQESKLLRDSIQSALQTSAISSAAAAEGLRLLVEDGASATQAAENLGASIAYAQANTTGLSQTIQSLGAVLDTFGEGPEKIAGLADSLTATARAAGTSTQALEKGLAAVGIAATQTGLDMNEALVAIGALAQRGIESTKAGVQLTKVLQEMSDPASKAGEALQEAGIDTKDLSGIFTRLASDGALAERVLAGLGDRPRAALKVLLDEGGGALKTMEAALIGVSGASQEASDQLGDKFALAWQRAQNAIENARNSFLEPILAPIATELNAFASDLNTFANSPEFKRIAEQLQVLARDGLKAAKDLLEGFDLDAALLSVKGFAALTVESLGRVREVMSITGDSAVLFSAGVVATFEAARTGIAASLGSLVGAFADFSDTAAGLSVSLAAIAEEARDNTGAALATMKLRLDAIAVSTDRLNASLVDAAPAVAALGAGAAQTTPSVNFFGQALDEIGTRGEFATDSLVSLTREQIKVRDTAVAAASAQEELADATSKASTAAIESELARLVRTQADLVQSGKATGASMAELTAAIADAEGRLRDLKTANIGAGESTDLVRKSADLAADAMTGYSIASERAADAASNLRSKNSAVDESFGNITGAVSELTIGFDKLSSAYVDSVLKNGSNVGNSLISKMRLLTQTLDQQGGAFERQLEMTRRQIAAEDEHEQALDRLQQRYSALSRESLEPLLDAEERLNDLRNRRTEVNDRASDSEERLNKTRAEGNAGGLNYSQAVRVDVNLRADATAGTGTLGPAALAQVADALRPVLTRAVLDELARAKSQGGY